MTPSLSLVTYRIWFIMSLHTICVPIPRLYESSLRNTKESRAVWRSLKDAGFRCPFHTLFIIHCLIKALWRCLSIFQDFVGLLVLRKPALVPGQGSDSLMQLSLWRTNHVLGNSYSTQTQTPNICSRTHHHGYIPIPILFQVIKSWPSHTKFVNNH